MKPLDQVHQDRGNRAFDTSGAGAGAGAGAGW